MTFGGHLEVLRRMLFRIIAVAGTLSVIVFTCKETIWRILLAPSEYSFTTYTLIENAASLCGYDFHFEKFHVDLIATDLSSQFMTHVTTSVYLGLLGASPYIRTIQICVACSLRKRKEVFGKRSNCNILVVHSWSPYELLCIISNIVPFLRNLQCF